MRNPCDVHYTCGYAETRVMPMTGEWSRSNPVACRTHRIPDDVPDRARLERIHTMRLCLRTVRPRTGTSRIPSDLGHDSEGQNDQREASFWTTMTSPNGPALAPVSPAPGSTGSTGPATG